MQSAPGLIPFEILLAEDDPAQVVATFAALQDARLHHRLHVVADGVEAMSFLRREGRHLNALRPDLVLLDLHLPRKDGRQLLAEMKADPHLRPIPVVVMTAPDELVDSAAIYQAGALCCVTKPVDFIRFAAIIKALEHLCLAVVPRPPHSLSDARNVRS